MASTVKRPTISGLQRRGASNTHNAGVRFGPSPNNFLSMDWADLHCQRQFKRARNFLPIVTRANEPKLKSQAGSAYRVKLAHPTRFERVTFAFGARRLGANGQADGGPAH